MNDDGLLGKIDVPLGEVAAVIERAREVAHAHRMEYLGSESLLVALIHQPTPEIARAVEGMGIEMSKLEQRLEEFFVDLPQRGDVPPALIRPTPRTRLVMQLASRLTQEDNAPAMTPMHLFRAIEMEVDSMAGELLAMLRKHSMRLNKPAPAIYTVSDWRTSARQVMDAAAFDYFSSGADAQRLVRRNCKAWQEIEIRHRVLVDVSNVDTSTEVVGLRLPFPALIAPMAYQRLAHDEGELATAAAARDTGVPLVVSTMANVTLEAVAESTPSPKWFQLYCHRDRGITEDLVRRAEAAGYEALVVTVDAPVLGRRIADERNSFELPEGLTRANLARYEGDPDDETHPPGSHLTDVFATRQDASLAWRDIEWLRSLSRLPILLKGVVRSDDAERAIEHGCAGVIVSNHGGRQLDASAPTAHALPEVARAIRDRGAVLVDGGIEWGADILRALALGADAVLIGRPVLWGLAVGGQKGVRRVLESYAREFTVAMQLAGCARVADITGDLLARRSP